MRKLLRKYNKFLDSETSQSSLQSESPQRKKSLETFIETGILGIYTSIILLLIKAMHIQRTAYARGSFEI